MVPGILSLIMVAVATGRCGAHEGGEHDWPRWRGPDGNGISDESDWNPAALAAGPKIAWKENVGGGYSSVAVKWPYLYTMGNMEKQDSVYCFKADTGEEVWRHSYRCKSGSYPGPRATPAVEGASVYTVSRQGEVFCLDAARGDVKWSVNIVSKFGAKPPKWGHSGSPYLEGDMLILNAGEAGLALNRNTGARIWASESGIGAYATPVLCRNGDRQIALLFAKKALIAVDSRTGERAWSVPWVTSWDVNAADPIVDGSNIMISSGYKKGCALLDVSAGEPKVVWQNTLMRNHFSSSVLLDGHVYGIDGNAGKGMLRCMEFATGAEKWSEDLGFGGLMAAGGKLIVLNERGGLFIAEAEPESYKELSRGKLPSRPRFWTAPVLCGGRIYCRNDKGDLFCVDMSTKPAAQRAP